MSPWAACRASPSLALLKYWGKLEGGDNLPATPSLAVTLGGMYTDTAARIGREDSVSVGDELQDPERFTQFFAGLRSHLDLSVRFEARSTSSFPTSAGLASSSSGFAALAGACVRAAGKELPAEEMSQIARIGSASAARSVFGGFVLLPAGERSARQVFPAAHWPTLRVVAVITHAGKKPLSSREAMSLTARHSPYYDRWLTSAPALLPEALSALAARDLAKLGDMVLASYSMMHAALLAARPPVLYWLPETVALINACRQMRGRGIGAWETIDAGPQVKVLCEERDAGAVVSRVNESVPEAQTLLCFPGEGLAYPPVGEPGP